MSSSDAFSGSPRPLMVYRAFFVAKEKEGQNEITKKQLCVLGFSEYPYSLQIRMQSYFSDFALSSLGLWEGRPQSHGTLKTREQLHVLFYLRLRKSFYYTFPIHRNETAQKPITNGLSSTSECSCKSSHFMKGSFSCKTSSGTALLHWNLS